MHDPHPRVRCDRGGQCRPPREATGTRRLELLDRLGIVAAAVSCALAAHLVEITLWALLFMMCGEFSAFGNAFDHSAVSYTTLGNDNVIMSPSWRLLGALEAANGALMFGVSTAMIFTVVQRLVQTRYVDLRE